MNIEKYFIPLNNQNEVERLERDIVRKSVWKHVSIISKNVPLLANLTVWENITLPVSYFDNIDARASFDLALRLLRQYDISHIVNVRPNKLTGIEEVMVLYFRAIARQPMHTFFIKPSEIVDSEIYEQFVDFIQKVDNVNISIVDEEQYFSSYYSHICTKVSEAKWQELVLKILR